MDRSFDITPITRHKPLTAWTNVEPREGPMGLYTPRLTARQGMRRVTPSLVLAVALPNRYACVL
jgi:hypothetical protein